MKLLKKLVYTSLFVLTFSVVAHAHNVTPPPDTSSPELQRIKSLEGRWETKTSMFGKKDQRLFTEYHVTAGGSAVLERLFPGTPQEMVSVYYDDDHGKLAMTHYCIMRNRPTLKLVKNTDDTLTLNVAKVEGLKSKKDHSMGELTIHFEDNNHFTTTCNARGKKDEKPMTMEYTRVKSKSTK